MAAVDHAYDVEDDLDLISPRMRMQKHEDWLISTSLEPLRDSFEDSSFQQLLHQFAAEHAQDFLALWPDGSHPLLWTLRHQEYKELFESQLEKTLADIGMTRDSFQSAMRHLQDVRASLGDMQADLDSFLKSLTAADEYNAFLQVMLTEAYKQQEAGLVSAAVPDSQQIEVTVPSGHGGYAAASVPVEYQGYQYDVPIPCGYSAGMSFHVSVVVPPPN
ncbi:unnamed protein product [Symbiodinium necroappetens]|uniref:BART domain-containing protein n=1 Tax=Symbiodinium necroappetens TaxID=1628268 RepID=A0A812YQ64_9DINO|nr:unnamed protein product [Symbiodinium necroappetens]